MPRLGLDTRATVLDDRAKRVPLAPHDFANPLRETEKSRRLLDGWHRAKQPLTRREIGIWALWLLAALPLFAVQAFAPVLLTSYLKLPTWALIAAALPLAMIPVGVTIFIARRAAGQRLARAYAIAGYCASCGQDLRNLPTAQDGCTTCPECGAAWKLTQL